MSLVSAIGDGCDVAPISAVRRMLTSMGVRHATLTDRECRAIAATKAITEARRSRFERTEWRRTTDADRWERAGAQ